MATEHGANMLLGSEGAPIKQMALFEASQGHCDDMLCLLRGSVISSDSVITRGAPKKREVGNKICALEKTCKVNHQAIFPRMSVRAHIQSLNVT